MITQAAISLSGRKAFIFCRQNALYLAYAKNNVPSDPMVMQNGVYPGFNICPQKDGFLIFFRTSANTGAALKLTPGGILRPRLDENVLNVSTGTVFVYRPDKNTVLYSAPNGFIHSLSRQKALFESDNISSCRCIFLGDESYIVFARDSRLCLYSAGAEKTFELFP